MMFEPRPHLCDAIKSCEPGHVRQALHMYLGQDAGDVTGLPSAALKWASEQMPEIIEAHNDEVEPLVADETAWTDDYWLDQKTALNINFSEERWNHLIAVGAKLQAEGVEEYQPVEALVEEAEEREAGPDQPPRTFATVLLSVVLLAGSVVAGGALLVAQAGLIAVGACGLIGLGGLALLAKSIGGRGFESDE